MAGVFVIPKDELITYAQSNDGWSSVMYSNPKHRQQRLGLGAVISREAQQEPSDTDQSLPRRWIYLARSSARNALPSPAFCCY